MKKNDGFTLVELLLTLTLVAFVILVVYGLLETTILSANVIEEVIEGSQVGPAILRIIRQDLECVVLPNKEKEFFVGVDKGFSEQAEDKLDFISTTLGYGKRKDEEEERFSAINEVGYQVRHSEKGYFVLYRREEISYDDEPLKGGRLVELYDMVKSFNITYYNGKEWLNEWNNVRNGDLPVAVKVEITIVILQRGEGKEERYSTIIPIR
jgi:type II secretion system protein J